VVSTQRECAWTVSTNASWITGLTPGSGQGPGTIQFDVAANPAPSERSAEVAVNDARVQILQDSVACAFSVNPTAVTIPGGGGSQTVNLSGISGCSWNAAVDMPWLAVTTGASGNGSAGITVQASANTGAARTGSLNVAGQVVAISQSAAGVTCNYSIQPTVAPATSSGGSGSLGVTSPTGCAWSATSDVPWITFTSATGSGIGTVSYIVATNTGTSPRSGHVTVQGQTLTVNQAAAPIVCDPTINPTSRSVGPSGGAVATSVTVAPTCQWTAASNASWLTIASGATGNGSGSVNVDVAANSGGTRSGTLTVAGRVFTVTQTGCSFSLSSVALNAGAGTGSGSVTVTATAGCGWTAVSNASFLAITSGGSGTGNGTTSFSIGANSGPDRTGTLTVAGQTFTVTQSAGCTYSISPTSHSAAVGAESRSVSVTAPAGCQWNATSNASFLTIASGASGSGNGTTSVAIAANPGGQRVGTATIAGQTFTVTQAGCTFTISPTSHSAGSGAGSRDVSVTTAATCQWSATSNDSFLTITSGASDTGNGTTRVAIAANSGPQRVGTVTVAGQTFTVTQASGCTYNIAPTTQSFSEQGGNGSISVTTGPTCPWTAVADDDWIIITAGASGTGSGLTRYHVESSNKKRNGTITIAGKTFTVKQED
jgi:hypothetical protein